MTLISGPLSTVTADPTAVSVVQVSVQGPRTAGSGVQTHESKNVVVSGGVFSHEIAPGPATLTMVVGQQPGPPIPILVDDVESQTLASAVNAAKTATGEHQKWLEDLALQVITGTQGPQGLQGPPGQDGATGVTPSLMIGDVTTVPAGGDASADIRDIGDDWYAIDLGIPRGDTGSISSIDQAVQNALNNDVYPAINAARDDAVDEVAGVVDTEIGGRVDEISRGNFSTVLSTDAVDSYDTIPPGHYTALGVFFQGVGLTGSVGSGSFTRTYTNFAQNGAVKLDVARWVLGGKIYQYFRSYSSSGWTAWLEGDGHDTLAEERDRTIPNGTDWDTIVDAGEYRRTSTTHTATNNPATTLGVLVVHDPQHSSGQVTQTYFGAGGGGFWHRAKTSNRWTPWIRMDVVPDVPTRVHAGEARRDVIVELGKRKRGGVIGTDGLPAVALRFDHHLDPFDTKVLPLLKQYGLPWMQAINPGNLGSGDDNWTAAKLSFECHNSGGEVYNHGLDHSTYSTESEANTQITSSLQQLHTNLPSLHIDGWAPFGSFPQMDYLSGKAASDIYGTYPGQLILAQHAFIRTYLPGGAHELLNGPNMIGAGHSTIDGDTTGAAIRGLRAAIARGMGITFMLHPNYLDQPGYMTTEQFEDFLLEIVSLRDADELRVLSCTGIMMADKARPDDFNLLGDLAVPDSSGAESVNSRGYLGTVGVPHEVEVWVKGSGAAELTVAVDSPTYPITTVREVALTSVPQRVSIPLTPPTDTAGITVELAGNVQHDGVKFRPI